MTQWLSCVKWRCFVKPRIVRVKAWFKSKAVCCMVVLHSWYYAGLFAINLFVRCKLRLQINIKGGQT